MGCGGRTISYRDFTRATWGLWNVVHQRSYWTWCWHRQERMLAKRRTGGRSGGWRECASSFRRGKWLCLLECAETCMRPFFYFRKRPTFAQWWCFYKGRGTKIFRQESDTQWDPWWAGQGWWNPVILTIAFPGKKGLGLDLGVAGGMGVIWSK